MAVAMQLEQKHSGLGIASFILGLGGGLLTFLVFFVAGIIGAANGGEIDEESVEAVMIGLFLMLFVFLDLLAIGLGIAGLMQKDRKKVFAVLGVACGASSVVLSGFLMLLGLMA